VIRITETGEKILDQLAVFRFLTADQLRRLGASPDINHIRETARRLVKTRPAVLGKMDYGVLIGHGRLPVIYHLTPYGASILAELRGVNEAKIQYPRGRVDARRDYFHRLGCVEFRVQLSQAITPPHTLAIYQAYYDYIGSNKGQNIAGRLNNLTTLYYNTQKVTPDGLFWVDTDEKGNGINRRLFIFEYSRGIATSRVVKQFETHYKMLVNRRYTEHFKLKKMPRICWVFDTENAMRAVRKSLKQKKLVEDKYAPALYFKTYDQMISDFAGNWSYVDPEEHDTRGLFDF